LHNYREVAKNSELRLIKACEKNTFQPHWKILRSTIVGL